MKAAGIDETHARAHAEGLDQALREEVATKSDLAELRAELKSDIAELRAAGKADIAEVRADIEGVKHEIDTLRIAAKADNMELKLSVKADLAALEATLLRWFIGTAIALVALTATIVKFLH